MTDLNEKLAILAGYKQLAFNDSPETPSPLWDAPDGRKGVFCPDYTHDLTACFEDIKPLLTERGIDDIGFVYRDDGTVICFLSGKGDDLWNGEADPEVDKNIEALAFCEAAIKFLSE